MSGVWVLGLAVGIVYCVQKKMQVDGVLDKAREEYYAPGKESTDLTTKQVRAVWKDTDDTRFGEMSTDLATGEREKLDLAAKKLQAEALRFDAALAPLKIEGVHFQIGA